MTTTELQKYRNKKRRELNRHLGISNRVAPNAARNHIAQLRQTMSWDRIATESGCSACYLRHIADGRVPQINRVTHNKIMAVRPAATRDGGFFIDATGSVRRVRALMARGHSQYAIAAAADTTQYRISLLASGQQRMRQKLADKIDRAYQLLADKDGTSVRARTIAATRNWHDPDYWEDVARIDDPTFDPDARDTRTKAIAEDGLELEAQGYTRQQAADRLGVTKDALQQAISRYRNALEQAA